MTDTPESPPPAPRPRSTNACTGRRGEELAADYLRSTGLDVVARNWRVALSEVRGELDIIALDHDAHEVVIVEVKTRRGGGYGGPLAAVTRAKQVQIRRLAAAALVQADLPYRTVRFDVIGIRLDLQPPSVDHVRWAF